MSDVIFTPPTLARRILICAMDHMRALDALSPDAAVKRESVLQAGELAVNKLLEEIPNPKPL